MRKFLIGFPVFFIVLLLQSYFWVPTYEEQTRGNPDRIEHYIEASIGDAQILNPILSADSASSEITAKVFEGLIDRDENLNFRGRIATHWELFEEAGFYINPLATPPGASHNDGAGVAALLRAAVADPARYSPPVAATLRRITAIHLQPARAFTAGLETERENQDTPAPLVEINAPERIGLVLAEVDQDLFANLGEVLGQNYFSSFEAAAFLRPLSGAPQQLTPAAAARLLPAVEHNPVIVFHLRPDVRFHDGAPLTAEDVRFTYEAIVDPRNLSPRLSDYEPVKTVEALDPLTVRVVYKRLFSPALGTWSMGILPAHLLNDAGLQREARERNLDPTSFTLRHSRLNRAPVGCGPFRFEEWRSDQFIRLGRFDGYWEGPPNFQGYVYRIIPDLFTQEMEFYAGTVDSYAVPPHQVARLGRNPLYQSFSGLSFAYAYVGYNLRRAPFDDWRVRTALGMAIDVESIIRYVLHDQGERLTGPFLKQTEYYDPHIPPLPYDPQGALALLAEAGWYPNGQGWLEKAGRRLEFTLITNQGNDIRKAILSIAQNAWRKIGVDVRTDVLEWAVFIQERVNKNDFDALVLGWSMGIDPDLYQIWHSSQTEPGRLNFAGFRNAQADELIVRIRQEYDHDRQVELCRQLHRIIATEQPYTFLYVGKWTAVLDRRIVIRTLDTAGRPHYARITPTPTGNYAFYFNKWVKLAHLPQFGPE